MVMVMRRQRAVLPWGCVGIVDTGVDESSYSVGRDRVEDWWDQRRALLLSVVFFFFFFFFLRSILVHQALRAYATPYLCYAFYYNLMC
jgi:hypothetical protein